MDPFTSAMLPHLAYRAIGWPVGFLVARRFRACAVGVTLLGIAVACMLIWFWAMFTRSPHLYSVMVGTGPLIGVFDGYWVTWVATMGRAGERSRD